MSREVLTELQQLRSQLAKKATFGAACSRLQLLIEARPSTISTDAEVQSAVFDTLKRCFTLLKTRYTTEAFWKQGEKLYTAAQAQLSASHEQNRQLTGWLSECSHHLEVESTTSDPSSIPAPPYLFEGQLSAVGEPPPRPQSLEDVVMQLAMLRATTAGQPGEPGRPEDWETQRNQLHAAAEAAGLEEVLQASLQEQQGRSGPPPASPAIVKALPIEMVTAERLAQLGGPGVQCSVCREEMVEGAKVQVMPCSEAHVFHPECLAPWLAQHNTCPVCRHELPTDDMRYEYEKERERQAEEDRKGAANAVSLTELLYT